MTMNKWHGLRLQNVILFLLILSAYNILRATDMPNQYMPNVIKTITSRFGPRDLNIAGVQDSWKLHEAIDYGFSLNDDVHPLIDGAKIVAIIHAPGSLWVRFRLQYTDPNDEAWGQVLGLQLRRPHRLEEY